MTKCEDAMTKRIANMLDGLELFSDFSYPELEVIGRYLNFAEASAGKVIFREGEPGDFLVILIEGRIASYKEADQGEQLLSNEVKGRVIGEMALLDNERRSATCIADSDCELLVLTQDNLKRLSINHPATAYHFMFHLARSLSRRLRRTSGILADFLGPA